MNQFSLSMTINENCDTGHVQAKVCFKMTLNEFNGPEEPENIMTIRTMMIRFQLTHDRTPTTAKMMLYLSYYYYKLRQFIKFCSRLNGGIRFHHCINCITVATAT